MPSRTKQVPDGVLSILHETFTEKRLHSTLNTREIWRPTIRFCVQGCTDAQNAWMDFAHIRAPGMIVLVQRCLSATTGLDLFFAAP